MDRTMSDQAIPTSTATPSPLAVWIKAIRVPSFTASVIPILVGSAMALIDRDFHLGLFVLMLLASVACHAGSNLANDYFDHVKGVDSAATVGTGKVIQRGLLSPAQLKRGMIVAFALATLLGLAIVAQVGWVVFALALASLAAAFFYTGGPKPLGYIALGEATVFVFMGLVMIGGSFYVHTRELTRETILVAIAVASLVAEILHANNIRDIETDRAAGKVTLATLLGRRRASHEYLLLILVTYLPIMLLVAFGPRYWPALLVVASLPAAFALVRFAYVATGVEQLNRLLRRTAGLHLRFGLLLTSGLVIRAIIDRL
jgi:1,4-dihydroxy-2-naphthoate octaprenyltransferase